MTNKEMLMGGGVITSMILGGVSLLKVSKLCKRLGATFDDIESRTTFEISDKLIDEVVSAMAERKLDRVIPTKVQETVDGIKAEAILKIKNDISAKVKALEPEIEQKLTEQVAGVSIDEAHKTVIEKAAKDAKTEYLNDIRREKDSLIGDLSDYQKEMKDKIEDAADDLIDKLENDGEERFNAELDNLTTRYKSRLDDVSNIYASLANKITH